MIEKSVKLFDFQRKIINCNKAIIVGICGRSSGKSFASSWWAFHKALSCEGMGLITAPTYQQAEVPIKYLMSILSDLGIPYTFNKIPSFAHSNLPSHNNILSILLNGKLKQIKMASSDVEDNLRSGTYSWAILDEGCYISEKAWNIISPTLRGQGTDFIYQTLIISSPAGKNWVYESFMEKMSDNIEVIRAPSWENKFQVDEIKLALWKETMSSRMYQQEICAEILDSNLNAIFYAYNKEILKPQKSEGNKFIVSLDQNVSPGAGVIMQLRGKKFHILDEIFIDDGATYMSYVKEIRKKIPEGATIDLCGDRSGNNRNVAALTTFYDSVMKELRNIKYVVYNKTLKSNPKVYESREEVNRLIERGLFEIDPQCKNLIKDFEMATWKEQGVFETDKKLYDPHLAEAAVYGVWAYNNSAKIATMDMF